MMNLYQVTEFHGLSGILTFGLGPPYTAIYFQKIPVAVATVIDPDWIEISYCVHWLDKATATDDLDGVAFGPKDADLKRRYIPLNVTDFTEAVNKIILDYAGRIFDDRIVRKPK